MGATQKNIIFSPAQLERMKKTKEALKKVTADLVEETKRLNSYLVVSESEGNIKKIPASDL